MSASLRCPCGAMEGVVAHSEACVKHPTAFLRKTEERYVRPPSEDCVWLCWLFRDGHCRPDLCKVCRSRETADIWLQELLYTVKNSANWSEPITVTGRYIETVVRLGDLITPDGTRYVKFFRAEIVNEVLAP